MIDFYELLGVKVTSTKTEIKKAYHTMVKKYHPDVNKSAEASEVIKSLNEAKEVLLDDEKRKEYDEMLNDIKYSKQFSYEKEETYTEKKEVYEEVYGKVTVTRWQFLLHYLKNGVDNWGKKIIKLCFVSLNFILFLIIKGIIFGLLYIMEIVSNGINYIVGFLMFMAILALFVIGKNEGPNYLPFIPGNVEMFCYFSVISFIIGFFKYLVIEKSINLYVWAQNIEDKIFLKILMH